jgi:hypothetical protein
VVNVLAGTSTPTRTPDSLPFLTFRALHACSPSRPRSLALALRLPPRAVRYSSVFSSCRSLLSGSPCALTSHVSPFANTFAIVPCRSRLLPPSPTNRHCLPRPSPRVSACASLSPAHTYTTHCAFSKLVFPPQSSDPSRQSNLFTEFTTWPAPGRTAFLDCLFSAGAPVVFRLVAPTLFVVCSCSAESSGSVVRTRVGGRRACWRDR